MAQYKRAPITEAVIEIRFETLLSKELVDNLHERLLPMHSSSVRLAERDVHVDVDEEQATFDKSDAGYKLANKDQNEILLITPKSMVCSRLAPYKGWENFRSRAEDIWKRWKKVAGYHRIQRLGIRYINRIDIPVPDGEAKIQIEDYLTVYPEYPEPGLIFGLSAYTMQIAGSLGVGDFYLTMNTKAEPPPLLEHLSIVLDLDVSLMVDVPQKDGDIWKILEEMRHHKNDIFEASITDKSRELFDR